MGGEVLRKVQDRSDGPPRGSERVGGPSTRSRKGRVTFPEVRDGWGGPQEGPGQVRWSSQRFGTGWGTLY